MKVAVVASTAALAVLGLAATFPVSSWAAPPTSFSLVSPADGASLSARTAQLEWSRSTGSSKLVYDVRVDGQRQALVPDASCATTCTYTQAGPLSDGPHTWMVLAEDENGATGPAAQTFVIDAPLQLTGFTVDGGVAGPVRILAGPTCPTPIVTTDDPALGGRTQTGVTYALDGGPYPFTGTCALSAGAHTLVATVQDRQGHTQTATLPLKVDLVAPAATIVGSTHGVEGSNVLLTAFPVAGSFDGAARFSWQLPSGGTLANARVTIPLTQPAETVTLSMTDGIQTTTVPVHLVGGPKPPAGRHGISVPHDRSPHRWVELHVIWPKGATKLTLWNPADGKRKTVPVARTVLWTLASSKHATTVRAKFDWPLPAKTYSTKVRVTG